MAWHRTSGDNGGKLEVKTASGDIASFETNLVAPYQSVLVNVQATGGNGTPDNPNPINGYTEANITRCGVNVWNEEWKIITQSGRDWITNKNPIPVQPNHTYYISTPFNASIDNVSSTGSYISYIGQKGNEAFTTPSNCHYIRFLVDTNNYGITYNNDISINYPSTDTSYHAYTGNTYTIAFGQTVYGSVLDVTRGKLHVTYGKDSFSDKSFTQYSTGFFAITDYTSAKPNGTGLCEIYTVVVDKSYANAPDNSMQFRGNQILIKDTSCSDVTALIARTGSHEFIYELTTPIDIDLTPEVISAVVGTNNVFADCGQTTVKYLKRE